MSREVIERCVICGNPEFGDAVANVVGLPLIDEKSVDHSRQQFMRVVLVKCHTLWPLTCRILVIHDGDLAKYRGCSPFNWAISRGEREIIVTAFEPTERIDYGVVIGKESMNIPEEWEPLESAVRREVDAYATLSDRSVRLWLEDMECRMQPPSLPGRYWRRRTSDDAVYLSSIHGAAEIYWGARASGPPICDYATVDGIEIRRAKVIDGVSDLDIGTAIDSEEGIRVTCADRRVLIIAK